MINLKNDDGRYLHIYVYNLHAKEKINVILVELKHNDGTVTNEYYYVVNSIMGFFNNIILDDVFEINIISEISSKNIFTKITKHREYTDKQESYNEKMGVVEELYNETRINYAMYGNKENPKKILFTFPGFAGAFKEVKYLVFKYSSLQKNILENKLKFQEDILIVAFQDNYLSSGSYMLMDDEGKDITDVIRNKMNEIKNKYNIPDKDLIILGASKGASIALYYSQFFTDAKVIVSVPQFNLNKYNLIHKDNVYNLINRLERYNHPFSLDYYKILEKLIKEERELVLYIAKNDPSNVKEVFDLESSKNFKIISKELKHGQVTKVVNDDIIEEIKGWVER